MTDIDPEMGDLLDQALAQCGFSFMCSMLPNTHDKEGRDAYKAAIQRGEMQLWGTYMLEAPPAMWEIIQGLVWSADRVADGQSFLEYAEAQDYDECGVMYPLDLQIWEGLQSLGLNRDSLVPLVTMFDTIHGGALQDDEDDEDGESGEDIEAGEDPKGDPTGDPCPTGVRI